MSLCEDTKLSITTSGFRAKKATPKSSSFTEDFCKIFPIKNVVPRKLTEIMILKRKNVGKKNCKPTYDKGTVKTSQVGPYGNNLCVQCMNESIGSAGKSNAL